MCDYSLHSVNSRPAKIGDVLRVTHFCGTMTRGLCDANDMPSDDAKKRGVILTAVCLMPGCELRFDKPLLERRGYGLFASLLVSLFGFPEVIEHDAGVATFRKVNENHPATHHDALELPSGKCVLINSLEPGQLLTVLQVPADKRTETVSAGSGGVPGPVVAAHWPMAPELEPAHH
jgi:hypothetical protein